MSHGCSGLAEVAKSVTEDVEVFMEVLESMKQKRYIREVCGETSWS